LQKEIFQRMHEGNRRGNEAVDERRRVNEVSVDSDLVEDEESAVPSHF